MPLHLRQSWELIRRFSGISFADQLKGVMVGFIFVDLLVRLTSGTRYMLLFRG